MMTELTGVAPGVPKPIVSALRRLIRRTRAVIALKGVCAVVAVAVGSLLTIMAVDASVTILSAWPRYLLTIGAWAATIATALTFLVRPLVRSFTLTGIARAIEARHPELHERISSAVQLLTSPDAPELRGSDALIAALATEATDDARRVTPRREVTFRPLRPFAIAAGVVVAILGVLLLTWPDRASLLLARAVAPNANLPHVSAASLNVSPGRDVVLAEGERLEVELVVENTAVGSAEVRIPGREGSEAVVEMSRVGQTDAGWPKFAHSFPPATESFRYRLRAGDGGPTRYYAASVVRRPTLRSLAVRYEYPPYTGRRPFVERDAQGDIAAVAGTRVIVSAEADTPLTGAKLRINNSDEHVEPLGVGPAGDGGGRCEFAIDLTADLKGTWTLQLVRSLGGRDFESVALERRIEAVDDAAPTARIVGPDTTKLKLKRDDIVPVSYRLSDDFGLSGAELTLGIDGGKLDPIPLPLPGDPDDPDAPVRHAAGRATLDLAALELTGAKYLTFQLRTVDNLPPELAGPQEGLSAVCTVELDSDAASYVVQVQMAHELLLRQVLQQVLERLKEAKKHTAPLRDALKKAHESYQSGLAQAEKAGRDPATVARPELTDGLGVHVSAAREELSAADAALQDLLEQISGGAYGPVGEKLSVVADDHVATAQGLMGQIKLTDEPKIRYDCADEADFHVDRAIDVVEELLGKMNVLTEMAREVTELQELAERQQQLAEARAAMEAAQQASSQPSTQAAGADQQAPAPEISLDEPQMSMEEWREAQAQLAQELAAKVRKSRSALPLQAEKDKERTVNLAEEARKLAAEQSALAGRTRQIEDIRQADDRLEKLAQQQAELAEQAAAEPLAADLVEQMKADAQRIADQAEPETIERASGAAEKLTETAAELRRQQATGELAEQAAQVAEQQRKLSAQAEEIAGRHEQATAAAAAAEQQKSAAEETAAAAEKEIGERLRKLAERQKQLAEQAAEVEKQVAANPATAGAKNTRPSSPMQQAARQMDAGNLEQSAAQAKQAAQQTEQLDRQLTQAVEGAKQQSAAGSKAAEVAKNQLAEANQQVAEAKAAAKEAADDLAAARQAADKAAEKASVAEKTLQQTQRDGTESVQKARQAAQDAQGKATAADQALTAARQQAKTDADAAQVAEKRAAEAEQKARQAAQAAAKAKEEGAADAEQKQAAAEKARQAAEQARAQAGAAKAKAKESAQAAEGAEKQASDAEAGLAEARKQQQEAEQAAAKAKQDAQKALQQAQSELQTARQQATQAEQASRKQTDAAARAAQAAQQAEQTLAKATESGEQQSGRAASAEKTGKAAKELAAAQKQIAEELDKLAAHAGRQLAEVRKTGGQAEAKRQKQAQLAAQAEQQAAQLAGQQQQLAKQAAQLAEKAKQATPAAREQVGRHDPSEAMDQAAAAMQQRKPTEAAEQAVAAAGRADELANALDSDERDAPAQLAQRAVRAEQLAAKQKQLAEQAKQIAARRKQLKEQQAAEQLARLKDEQERLAEGFAEASDEVKEIAPQPDRLDTHAARAAREAAKELREGGRPEAAADHAADAGQRMEELANRLGAEVRRPEAPQDAGQGEPGEAGESEPVQEAGGGEPSDQGGQPTQQSGQPPGGDPQASDQAGQPGESEAGDGQAQKGQPSDGQAQGGEPSGGQASGPPSDGQPDGSAPRQQGTPATPDGSRPESDERPGGEDVAVEGSTQQEPDQILPWTPYTEAEKRRMLGERIARLAGRQQRVAEQMRAAAENLPGRIAGIQQEEISEGTGEVARGAELIRDHALSLMPSAESRTLAEQAVAELGKSLDAQQQASQAIAAESEGQAVGHQQASAQHLTAAAAALDRLGAQLAAEAAKRPPMTEEEEAESGHLTETFEAAEEAAREEGLSEAERASRLLQELARGAQARAQQMGLMPMTAMQMTQMTRPHPGETLDSRFGSGFMVLSTEDVAALEAMGISSGDWARLPGELRDDVLQAADDESPAEYRELIKQYFREVARRGGKAQTPNDEEAKTE